MDLLLLLEEVERREPLLDLLAAVLFLLQDEVLVALGGDLDVASCLAGFSDAGYKQMMGGGFLEFWGGIVFIDVMLLI